MTSVARNATTLAWWARVLAVLTVAVGLVALPIMQGVAAAGTGDVSAGTTTATGVTSPSTAFPMAPAQEEVDGGGRSESVTEQMISNDKLLPMNRWGKEATSSFHTRSIGSKFNPATHLRQYSRDVVSGSAMAAGNAMWSMTSWVTSTAMNIDPIARIGTTVDKSAASVGNALLGRSDSAAPSLILALLVIGIIGSFWDSYRRGTSFFKDIIVRIGVMAIFILMVGGAMNTTDTTYGKFSPGWLVTNLNSTVSQIASAPAALVTMEDLESGDSDSDDPMSCQRYEAELRHQYAEEFDINTNNASLAASMPLVLNGMWESTSLESWKSIQFGGSSHGDFVGCRLLDRLANVPVDVADDAWTRGYLRGSTTFGVMENYWPDDYPDLVNTSIAFNSVNSITTDVSLVGWAACEWDPDGDWKMRNDGLFNGDVDSARGIGDDEDSDDSGGKGCGGWWNQSPKADVGGYHDGKSSLNWPDGDDIHEDIDKSDDRDFLLAMHGENMTSSFATAATFTVSSLMVMVVFAGFSIVIMFLKVAMLVLLLTVFAYLAAALLPRVNVGEKLGGFFKSLLGMILLTAGAILLFSVVGMMTRLIMELGDGFFDAGGVPAMVWTGMSPVLAFFALAWTFKKVLGTANPLSIKGAMAWGGGAGLVGGAVGSAISNTANRVGQGAKDRAGEAAKDTGGRAVSAATGGRLGGPSQGRSRDRHGAMTPRDRSRLKGDEKTDMDKKALVAGSAGAVAAGADGGKVGEDGKKLTASERRGQQVAADRQTLEGIDPELAAAPRSKASRDALKNHRANRVKEATRVS